MRLIRRLGSDLEARRGRKSATAGPSTTLRFAQDDSSVVERTAKATAGPHSTSIADSAKGKSNRRSPFDSPAERARSGQAFDYVWRGVRQTPLRMTALWG